MWSVGLVLLALGVAQAAPAVAQDATAGQMGTTQHGDAGVQRADDGPRSALSAQPDGGQAKHGGQACTCDGDGTGPSALPQALKQATAVFEGRVDNVQPGAGGTLSATLHVVRSWKGADREQMTVVTTAAGDACAVELVVGRSYLVFADADGHAPARPGQASTAASATQARVSRCSLTQPAADAGELMTKLGAGVVPVDPSPEGAPSPIAESLAARPARGGCAGCQVTQEAAPPMLGGASLFVLVMLAFRVRARRT